MSQEQETLHELGNRVARVLHSPAFVRFHENPSHITEWPRLMAEYEIEPQYHGLYVVAHWNPWTISPPIPHDRTISGKLEATARAVLLAVLEIEKGKERTSHDRNQQTRRPARMYCGGWI